MSSVEAAEQPGCAIILCFHQGTLVVLHGFIKKTRKAPAEDIGLAKRRMKEVIR